jgi:hypothetical protein
MKNVVYNMFDVITGKGSSKALLRLYYGSIKALLRLCRTLRALLERMKNVVYNMFDVITGVIEPS